jgi:hypothetical protein
MARKVSNPGGISNNDLVLLRKGAKKYTKVLVTTGTKKFTIEETNVSVISSKDGFSFISIPATNVIYKGGVVVTDPEDVKAAVRSLKQVGRKPVSRSTNKPELPEELRKQIEAFAKQANGRVIFDPTEPGGYKVQRIRPRRSKG